MPLKPRTDGWTAAQRLLKRAFRALDPIEVVDVGANPIEGEVPYRALLDAGLCRVTGFEPQEAAHARLMATKSLQETYHRCALGAGGPATLHLYQHSGFTSLFPIEPRMAGLLGFGRATRETATETIETTRLDDVADLARIDFLKIDVQGAERDIIAAGRARLAQAVLVQTEVRFVPLYQDEPGFAGIDSELRAQGFLFRDFAFLKRVHLRTESAAALRRSTMRQVVDGDAFYIRDLTDPAAVSDMQLQRLALLATFVMQDAGLALFCLDRLVERGACPARIVQDYLHALPARLRMDVGAGQPAPG